MTLIRSLALLALLALVTGCGGGGGGPAVAAPNPAPKPPPGNKGPITNADGTVTEGSSAGKMQDPVE